MASEKIKDSFYNQDKLYNLDEAVKLVKDSSTVKFDASIDVAINLNVDPRHAEENIRISTSLPSGTGKAIKVLVLAEGPKVQEALDAGADFCGSKDYIDKNFKHQDIDGRKFSLGDITGPGGAKKGNPFYKFLGVERYWAFGEEKMNEMYDKGEVIQTKPGTVPRRKRYLDEMPGVAIQTLWTDINPVQSQSYEKTLYPTQKPEALLERIINFASNKEDIICDFFAGSGTTAVVSKKLGRNFYGIEKDKK